MAVLQELVHKVEVVSGSRTFKFTVVVLAVMLLLVTYNLAAYKDMSTQEAMDAAQLGRNIAEGKGYTTLFIRPFSMHLVEQRNREKLGPSPAGKLADYARIRDAHPDISNPPLYPLVLAGLMKVLPFDFEVTTTKSFWSQSGYFLRYEPEFLIAIFNELVFMGVVLLAYLWARRLFDRGVAILSAAVLLGTNLLWRFSVSGLSTMLLLVIFMGLVWCLTLVEAEAQEAAPIRRRLTWLALLAGALVGLGGLTRYAFAWILVPVLVFFILFSGPRRVHLCLLVLAAFAVVMGPWIARNYSVSGTPFGTATFSVLEGTGHFQKHRLERSLSPDIQVFLRPIWAKLFVNTRSILQNIMTNLGGGWVTAFFLTGLLIVFRSQAIRRLRYFLLLSIGVFIVVQALGHTQLSADSPEINSENLLVLMVPLVVIYGVAFFFMLLDQVAFEAYQLRYAVIGLFCVLVCLPMIFALLPPRTGPLAYPPYNPQRIQLAANWMKENELMMSDIPWAVAWYGDRQCVWLTLNATPDPASPDSQEDFFAINDFQKPISALLLTPESMNTRLLSDLKLAGPHSWGHFIMGVQAKSELPMVFPLRQAPKEGFMPDMLFLSDWKRW